MTIPPSEKHHETDWSFAKIIPDRTIQTQTPETDNHFQTEKQTLSERIVHTYTEVKEMVSDIVRPEESTPATSRSKTILFALSCCFSILLLASIFYQIRINRDTARKKQFVQTIERVTQQYQESVVLTDLNPTRARELLSSARSDVGSVLGAFDEKSREYRELLEWQEKIRRQDAAAYHVYELSDVPVFFDITLIKSSGSGTRMAAYGKKKVILDTTHQTIYLLSTDTKQATILAGPDSVKDAKSLAIHGNTVYVIHADGIAAINSTNKKTEIVVPHDNEWGSIAGLETYGGNLYLLDSLHQKIWKYIATEDGFSDRQEYLREGVPVSISPDARIMIDGSIWVKNNTEVFKFGGGIADTFAITGMSEGDMLQAFDAISSSDEENFVYVLDRASGRIVVLEKSGAYHGQYHWDGFRTVDDIIASEEEKKIFALQGSKIYAIELK